MSKSLYRLVLLSIYGSYILTLVPYNGSVGLSMHRVSHSWNQPLATFTLQGFVLALACTLELALGDVGTSFLIGFQSASSMPTPARPPVTTAPH